VTDEFRQQEKMLMRRLRELGRLRKLLLEDQGKTLLTADVDGPLRELLRDIQNSKIIGLNLDDDKDDKVESVVDFEIQEAEGERELRYEDLMKKIRNRRQMNAKNKDRDKMHGGGGSRYKGRLPRYFFKECAVVGNRYFCIEDGKTEYVGGEFIAKPLCNKDSIGRCESRYILHISHINVHKYTHKHTHTRTLHTHTRTHTYTY